MAPKAEEPSIRKSLQNSQKCKNTVPMAEEVLLFGVWASPFSRRIEMALKLKGVQYKFFDEDLDNKSPLLLKYNPVHKKVPVLVHNGKPIAESLIILEYIDETWQGYPLLSKDPYESATERFWAKFIDEKCLPGIFKASFGQFGEEKEREKAIKEASELVMIIENELGEKKFFGGETIGMVDIAANFFGLWVGAFEEATGLELVTKEQFPKLSNWAIEFVSCSAIKENLPPRDELIALLQNRFGKGNASK